MAVAVAVARGSRLVARGSWFMASGCYAPRGDWGWKQLVWSTSPFIWSGRYSWCFRIHKSQLPDFGVHLRQRLEVQPESVFVGQPRVRCHHQVRKVVKQFGHAFITVPRANEIRARISTALSGMNPPGLMILRHAPEQCYQFGVSGSALRSFSWGIPSKASYCGDTENEAIDEAINWVASVVLEGEDGM